MLGLTGHDDEVVVVVVVEEAQEEGSGTVVRAFLEILPPFRVHAPASGISDRAQPQYNSSSIDGTLRQSDTVHTSVNFTSTHSTHHTPDGTSITQQQIHHKRGI